VSCRGHSLLLQRRLTDFGAEKSFARAAGQVKEHYGFEISPTTVRRVSQAQGQRLHGHPEFLQGEAAAEPKAQLIVEADGTMIPVVTTDPTQAIDQRKTRKTAWKEARLSLVQEQGAAHPIFGANTGSPEQVGEQMAHCATRVGWDAHTRIHGVGDGAPWIADQVDGVFGAQGRYLIDFYHLCEYLAAASKSCSSDPRGWYEIQKDRFLSGRKEAVLEALAPHIEPSSVDEQNAPVRVCNRYIRNRPGQFDYPGALRSGLPIGSGRNEGAHRYVIQERLKLSGAWWKIDNADKMLALRVTRINGNWEKYWTSRKTARSPGRESTHRQPLAFTSHAT